MNGRGFTLLELLVALAVFAILSVMAYQGLRTVGEVRQRVEGQAERLASLQLALGLLERDLEQAASRPVRDGYGDLRPAFEGSALGPEIMAFTRSGWRNPAGLPRSNLQRVAYRYRDGVLYRRHWRVLDQAQDSAPVERPLLEGVEALELRFLDHGLQWQGAWPADPERMRELLPRAVEITLDVQGIGEIRRLFRLPPGEAARRAGEGGQR